MAQDENRTKTQSLHLLAVVCVLCQMSSDAVKWPLMPGSLVGFGGGGGGGISRRAWPEDIGLAKERGHPHFKALVLYIVEHWDASLDHLRGKQP